jgi:hypothetical protein
MTCSDCFVDIAHFQHNSIIERIECEGNELPEDETTAKFMDIVCDPRTGNALSPSFGRPCCLAFLCTPFTKVESSLQSCFGPVSDILLGIPLCAGSATANVDETDKHAVILAAIGRVVALRNHSISVSRKTDSKSNVRTYAVC